jgi:hypothetical protein
MLLTSATDATSGPRPINTEAAGNPPHSRKAPTGFLPNSGRGPRPKLLGYASRPRNRSRRTRLLPDPAPSRRTRPRTRTEAVPPLGRRRGLAPPRPESSAPPRSPAPAEPPARCWRRGCLVPRPPVRDGLPRARQAPNESRARSLPRSDRCHARSPSLGALRRVPEGRGHQKAQTLPRLDS